jgi:hypothetical protein
VRDVLVWRVGNQGNGSLRFTEVSVDCKTGEVVRITGWLYVFILTVDDEKHWWRRGGLSQTRDAGKNRKLKTFYVAPT